MSELLNELQAQIGEIQAAMDRSIEVLGNQPLLRSIHLAGQSIGLGEIGGNSVERQFCQRAQQYVRGDWRPEYYFGGDGCPNCNAERLCGLCGYRHCCLFCERIGHPDWMAIYRSELLKDPLPVSAEKSAQV